MRAHTLAQIDGTQEGDVVRRLVAGEAWDSRRRCTATEPYQPLCDHSFFRDRLVDWEARRRQGAALESPILRGRDQGAADFSEGDLAEARQRLQTVRLDLAQQKRDLSTGSVAQGLTPSTPSWLNELDGQASRATGTLFDALDVRPLSPGMVDTSSGVPVIRAIPRLSAGATTAVQTADNAIVSETDPTTAATAVSPVATIAGQVDMSRQLFDLSQPGLDAVIAEDLARDAATKADVELLNGTASAGRPRGLLNWNGILSVIGTVTNAQTFLSSIWQAYSQLAGPSGYGASDTSGYLTVLHPRRAAWLLAGVSGTLPPGAPIVPGRLVVTAGIATNLGAGTNEDVALVIDRDQVVVAASGPDIAVYEEVGSGTLTVRVQARRYLALVVRNANAVAKITGLTAPAGF